MSAAPPLGAKAVIKEVLRTKSGLVGILLIICIAMMAVLVPIYAPYDVVKKWNDPSAWLENPRCAAPVWYASLIGKKLPENIVLEREDFYRRAETATYGKVTFTNITLTARFRYIYDDFPSEIRILVYPVLAEGSMSVEVTLVRPDGERIKLFSKAVSAGTEVVEIDSFTSDEVRKVAEEYVVKVCGGKPPVVVPEVVFFAKKDRSMANPDTAEVLKGRYQIVVNGVSFTANASLMAEAIIYGKVFGLAGTDGNRRDLFVGIIWGAPVALAFGIIAALVVTFLQAIFGVISGYFGGLVDEVIQRITEIFMIIPILPILILISFIYRIDVWTLLLVIIALSPLGSTTKVVRSMVPQIKEEQYVLAAISYGAGSWRIILRHVLPRVIPYTFSLIALSVPVYIFLEAALAIIGLGDPIRPTWGKILSDAWESGAAYHGYWWWILLPAGAITVTAVAFALLGYAFDKVVNPRLREM